MGIHICPVYLKGRVTLEDELGKEIYMEEQDHPTFETLRMIGDSDFAYCEDFEWIYEFEDPEAKPHDWSYKRPKDIDQAISWLNANYPGHRLIELLEEMKTNDKLWLIIS